MDWSRKGAGACWTGNLFKVAGWDGGDSRGRSGWKPVEAETRGLWREDTASAGRWGWVVKVPACAKREVSWQSPSQLRKKKMRKSSILRQQIKGGSFEGKRANLGENRHLGGGGQVRV